MNIVDRRADQLVQINTSITEARTFADVLRGLAKRQVLLQQLAAAVDEVNGAARGWVFVVPPAKRQPVCA